MITNKIAENIVNITFALTIMISSIGWLGIKKSKKSYFVLWIALIPLLINSVFIFFTNAGQQSILLIIITLISYIIYVLFLIVNTYYFFRTKPNANDNEIVNKTITLLNNI